MSVVTEKEPNVNFEDTTILIVDDTAANLDVLFGYLEDYGFTILVATDGESAVERALYAQPDIILLDILLPDIDGFEACRRLKASERTRDIPVIFMTALTETSDKIKGFQVGAVDYITKPLQEAEILVRITTHLRLRELTERLEQKVQERTQELDLANQQLKAEISERKRIEEQLTYQANLLENVSDAVISTNMNFIIQSWNKAAEKMYGWTADEAINQSIDVLLEQEDAYDPKESMLQKFLESGQYEGEVIQHRKDGSQCNVWRLISMLLDSDGNLVGTVTVNRDITDRKQIEKDLEQEHNILRTLLDTLPDAVYIKDAQSRFITCNLRQALLAGFSSPEDLVGKTDLDIFPEHGAHYYADEQALLQSGQAQIDKEERIGEKLGEMRWHLTSRVPLHDAEGNIVGLVGTGRDITKRKQTEEELANYSKRLEKMVEERTEELQDAHEKLVRQEKLAALGQLAGSVGHELRNPLGVISNAVYFLQMTFAESDDTTKEYLELIASRVQEAGKIITDLLNLSRTRPAKREELEMSDLITDVLHRHPPPENITVTSHINSGLPGIFVDFQQIEQVLVNLVINAYQAMPDGGALTFETSEKENQVLLSVRDTGHGMPPRTMAKIFEPLFTTKAKGIGLGLALSKNLIEVNGGSLGVESVEEQGTTFTITLPVGLNN